MNFLSILVEQNSLIDIVKYSVIFLATLFLLLCLVYIFSALTHVRRRKHEERIKPYWTNLVHDYLNGDPAVKDLKVPQKDRAILKNLILEIAESKEDERDVENLKGLYEHFGFLDEDEKLLASRKWWERANAVLRLKTLRVKKVEEKVFGLLKDERLEVSLVAIDYMGFIGSKKLDNSTVKNLFKEKSGKLDHYILLKLFPAKIAPANLKGLAQSTQKRLKRAAAILMGRSGDEECIDYLKDLLESQYEDIRIQAVRSLGVIGSSKAFPLLEEMVKDKSPMVRVEVASSLGAIKDPQSLEPLEELSGDRNYEVRLRSFLSLAEFGEQGREIIARYRESNPEIAREAMLRSYTGE